MFPLKLLIAFLFSIFLFGQNTIDQQKSFKYKQYDQLMKKNPEKWDHYSPMLLKYAQTDYEKAYANYIMGNIMYKASKYLMAVDYYESAEKYGEKLDSIDLQRYYTNGLVNAYRRAGLIEQSNEAWDREKKMNKKSKDKYIDAEYYYNLSKIYDIDEDYCKSAKAKIKYLQLVPDEIKKTNPNYIFGVYSQLAFVQIKCGTINDGQKSLQNAFDIVEDKNRLSDHSLYELYMLSKALLEVKNGKESEAKLFFNEAYSVAKNHKSITLQKLILSERLDANLDDKEDQINFSKEINEINKIEKETTKKLTINEALKSKERIQQEKYKANIGYILSVLCGTGIIFLIAYNQKKNKKLRNAYEKIIENLDKKDGLKNDVQTLNPDESKEIGNEKNIVKQLEALEQKQFFTAQNMSATQLAAMLKITPRNLSYILKKYRNDDFYNYLNNQRIDYFIRIVKENPKFRNYKIAALAEMCGYNSYSQFAVNFKGKKGISPSQFISFLQKNEK